MKNHHVDPTTDTGSTTRAMLRAAPQAPSRNSVRRCPAQSFGASSRHRRLPPETTPGKPGDFDFLTGNWKIWNRKLKAGATKNGTNSQGRSNGLEHSRRRCPASRCASGANFPAWACAC